MVTRTRGTPDGWRGLIIALSLLFGGCERCSEDQLGAPNVPESVLGEDLLAPRTNAGSGEGSAQPERPVIVHETPPALRDFEVAPVEGDWTSYRGASHRSGLRLVRAVHTPHIEWSVQIGIQGYANTPIVTEDAIYVSSQGDRHQRDDDRDGVYALDPDTGRIVWHYPCDQDTNGLTLWGDTLVVGTDSRKVIGIDRHTGEQMWVLEQDCQIYHAPLVDLRSTSPEGGLLLLRADDVGTATISAATGQVEGSLDCSRAERGSLSVDAERIYRAGSRALMAYDDRGRAWVDAPVVGQTRARGRWMPPLLTRSMLITAAHAWPFEEGEGIDLRPAAIARWKDNGQVAWVIDVNDALHANPEPPVRESPFLRNMPWVVGSRIIWTPTNLGALVAWDVETGERLEQVALPDCRNRAFGSIVGTPEMGYYARHDGVLYGFRPEPLEVVWKLGVGLHGAAGSSQSSHRPVQGPCSAEPKDGSAMFSTPAIGEDGYLYVGTGDGWLYKIGDESWQERPTH